MKVKRLVSSFVELLIRRPWLPAAAFLAPLLLALVSGVLLLANVSDSPYRFLPEFPDELIVALSNTGGWLAVFIAPGFAVEMLVLPVVLLFFRFARPAGRRMLAVSICALPIGFVLYVVILVLILLADIGHTDIARENIERKKEAERLGKKTYERKKIPHLRRMVWTFAGGHYRISRKGGDKGPEYYRLVDEWANYDFWSRRFDGRVLLEDVARWDEGKDRLYLETLKGKRYELEFATGKLIERKTWKKEEAGK